MIALQTHSSGSYGSPKCIKCSPGKYSNEGFSAYFSCPAGTFWDITLKKCNKCSPGTYSSEGSSTYTLCPAGTYSLEGYSVCHYYSGGYISGAGSSKCSKCPAGTYSYRNKICKSCPKGKTSLAGSSECLIDVYKK